MQFSVTKGVKQQLGILCSFLEINSGRRYSKEAAVTGD